MPTASVLGSQRNWCKKTQHQQITYSGGNLSCKVFRVKRLRTHGHFICFARIEHVREGQQIIISKGLWSSLELLRYFTRQRFSNCGTVTTSLPCCRPRDAEGYQRNALREEILASQLKFGEPLPGFRFKPGECIVYSNWVEEFRQGKCTP